MNVYMHCIHALLFFFACVCLIHYTFFSKKKKREHDMPLSFFIVCFFSLFTLVLCSIL